LPWVRVAAVVLNGDEPVLRDLIKSFVADGEMQNILEGFTRTKMHLDVPYKLLDAALGRSFLMLERLGYSPDNLPPDKRVN
jgi:hypothetical protein